jgi:hypothetical protein
MFYKSIWPDVLNTVVDWEKTLKMQSFGCCVVSTYIMVGVSWMVTLSTSVLVFSKESV